MDSAALDLYHKLTSDKRLRKGLSLLDFNLHALNEKGRIDKLVAQSSLGNLTSVAHDGAGGIFAFWQPDTDREEYSIVYLDSEGSAGRIADDLLQLIQLATSYPTSWQGVASLRSRPLAEIKDSLDYDEASNMTVSAELRQYFEAIGHDSFTADNRNKQIIQAAAKIRETLGLNEQADLLARVHRATMATPEFEVELLNGSKTLQFDAVLD